MKPSEPIEVESQAVAVRSSGAVDQALGINEILAHVPLIESVMKGVMKEGEHYGTVPGCGDKKTLLQPGAQKLTMTFRLAPEYQLQEVNLDRGHKEYRVVCTLKSIQSGTFVGQGVGCCSSMESKYRWRGGARICPECKKEAIIKGKAEFGGGWLCWQKKGGCGQKWPDGAREIEDQSIEKVENENPADCYNTVLKMAKKRAFVDATITATAASDMFTQDIGDDESAHEEGNGYTETLGASGGKPSGDRAHEQKLGRREAAASGDRRSTAPAATRTDSKPVQQKSEGPYPTEETRKKMIAQLEAGPGQKCRSPATEYLRKAGMLMPNEEIEDLPLRWVPATVRQMALLEAAMNDFVDGEEAKQPYASHIEPSAKKTKKDYQLKTPTQAQPVNVPRETATGSWRDFPCPFGKNAGIPLGKLSESSLAWYVNSFEVTTEYNGRPKKPETVAKDKRFREALDAAKAELGIEEREFVGD